MKILMITEFDCAGVGRTHRDALRAAGHDARLGAHFAFKPGDLLADWVHTEVVSPGGKVQRAVPTEEIIEFARGADVLVFYPGIGQPWSWSDPEWKPGRDAPFAAYLGIDWPNIESRATRRIAYFHGSRHAWDHRARYAAHFRHGGWELATSTLDYALALDAAYLPPVLQPHHAAPLREGYEPLRIVHSPTDPTNCQTPQFLCMLADFGGKYPLSYQVLNCEPHARVLEAKARAHACYDHLRGSFSVNTLEGCALGLVPMVGLSPENRARLIADGFPDLPNAGIVDVDGLRRTITALAVDAPRTAAMQRAAHQWFSDFTAQARAVLLDFFA